MNMAAGAQRFLGFDAGFSARAQDPALFLANARDVISRYRNHPSIAVWFGRNEGVPQPIINEGLADLVATLDGTRYYTGSSNSVNLQGSGPYNYRPPEQYFTGLARGFSVEVGTPSLATLESLRASIPPADRWPLSDTYAYHDWHFGGNGDVASFMAALAEQYGAGTSLEDFERKAQIMDYVSYRAIFEGFAAHLVDAKQRAAAVDDASVVAEQHLADLQLGLRYGGALLRGQEGLRAAARAARLARLSAHRREYDARRSPGADCAAACCRSKIGHSPIGSIASTSAQIRS
jgi:hypothetical protein